MPAPLLPSLLIASVATVASVLAARGLVMAAVAVRIPALRRRRMVARAREAGWTAALAQRWFRSPAALGGPDVPSDGYSGLTFAALGLVADGRGIRHTAVGTYQLVPVAPCPTLDGCARLVGTEVPAGGGLLVVGTCSVPAEATAVLVLGPLVQVPLPTVPWGWVRALTTPATDPLVPVESVEKTALLVRPMHARPQRERRMPSWRSPKPTTRRRARQPA